MSDDKRKSGSTVNTSDTKKGSEVDTNKKGSEVNPKK